MMRTLVIVALLVAAAPLHAAAGPLPRKLLQTTSLLSGGPSTVIASTNVWKRYDTAADSVIQNDAQAQARAGITHSVSQLAADTNKVGQLDSSTRQSLTSNDAQSVVQEAASGSARPGTNAAREAYSISQVASYGNGLNLDASSRAARANTDAQAAIQANLDDAFVATRAGGEATDAINFPSSHQWTN